MMYRASTQREFILPMFLILSIALIKNWERSGFRYAVITLLIVNLLFWFIRYSFEINTDQLLYRISLFGFILYEKKATQKTIKKVVFKRAGWRTKLALIKLNRGLPIRISLFQPTTIFSELITYCEKNNIDYVKTKEYKLLEKVS